MTGGVSQSVRRLAKRVLFPLPGRLAANQRQVGDEGMNRIRRSLDENFHIGWRSPESYSGERKMYERDVRNHLTERLESDRREVIPWLDASMRLRGSRILEVGCGTGSSTVALAEQGADVLGIDVDDGALAVARDRADAYGLSPRFALLNADRLGEDMEAGAFDMVIFFACLEHMTVRERLEALAQAWELLPGDGLLAIVHTPNRLWYRDSHTSHLPFFHWLPDDLALRYSRFSPRENFRELYTGREAESMEHFLRRGRGMSFHELELAIAPPDELEVVSSLSTHQGIRYGLRRSRLDRRYRAILSSIHPGLHEGFLDESLNLVLRKPAGP